MAWIVNKHIEIPKPQRVTIHAIGDWQIESGSCDRYLIKQCVDEIVADPSGGLSVFMGDAEDADRPTTRMRKRREFADREEVLDQEGKIYLTYLDHEVIPLLLPLAKTKLGMIGMLAGHHWKRLTRDLNSVQYICTRLSVLSGRKVPYLGQMTAWAWLRFHVGNSGQSVKKLVHLQHGEGGGQTLASALNRLERTAQGFEGDLYIRAHDCKLVAGKIDRLCAKDSEKPVMTHKTIGLMNVGSFTRGFTLGTGEPEYPEAAMMRPTTLGFGRAHWDIRRAFKHEDPSQNLMGSLRIEI